MFDLKRAVSYLFSALVTFAACGAVSTCAGTSRKQEATSYGYKPIGLEMFTRTLLLLLLLWGQDAVRSVRLIEMRVPAHAREGGAALLSCQYDLEGDELYSVKWYIGNEEFYRYVPKHQPSIIAFKRPGVHVNLTRSSSTVVVLENLSKESEGSYACEVSGEAPSFTTVRNSKHITIHLLPDSGPHVTGLKEQFFLDEQAVINCTSPASRPMAQLAWLVNEQPASQEDVQGPWYRVSPERPDAVETTLQLRFTVEPRHFVDSTMKLKCQATIAPLYQRETNSTHYIGLSFTLIKDRSPLEVISSSGHNTGSPILKHTKVGLFLVAVLSLL